MNSPSASCTDTCCIQVDMLTAEPIAGSRHGHRDRASAQRVPRPCNLAKKRTSSLAVTTCRSPRYVRPMPMPIASGGPTTQVYSPAYVIATLMRVRPRSGLGPDWVSD